MEYTLRRYQEEMGWNDHSLIHILCEYISNQNDDNSFEDYIQRVADEEKELCDEEGT
jgi:hypothetical protein